MEEQEFQEKIRMQKELFNQAKDDRERYYDEDLGNDDDHLFHEYENHHHHGHHHGHHHYESEEEKKNSERFLFYLIGEEGEDRSLSQDLMDDVVTFILSQPDYRLVRLL